MTALLQRKDFGADTPRTVRKGTCGDCPNYYLTTRQLEAQGRYCQGTSGAHMETADCPNRPKGQSSSDAIAWHALTGA